MALQNFSAEEMEFSADAGSIEASGLQMKKLILSVEAGAITLTDSEAAELEADAEAGAIRFREASQIGWMQMQSLETLS